MRLPPRAAVLPAPAVLERRAAGPRRSWSVREVRTGRRWAQRSERATVRSVARISRIEASMARLARQNGRIHAGVPPCWRRRFRLLPEAR
jgi:hypothetical protein